MAARQQRRTTAARRRREARRSVWLLPAVLLAALAMASCEPPAEPPEPMVEGSPPEVRGVDGDVSAPEDPASPAMRPAPEPGPDPLPEEALVALDEIEPAIEPPEPAPEEVPLPDRPKDLTLEGERRIADEDFDAARRALERAVGFAPDHPRIRRALGLAYLGLENAGQAEDNLQRSTAAAPDDLRAQLILGRIAMGRGQLDEAMMRLRTARACSKFNPDNPAAAETLLLLAKLLSDRGYWQASLECATTLSDWIDDHGRSYVERDSLETLVLEPEGLIRVRGELLFKLRRHEDAAEALERAFRRDRLDTKVPKLLVGALIEAGAYDQAESFLVELSSEPSQRGQIGPLAGELCRATGNAEVALRLWEQYRKRNPTELDVSLASSLARTAEDLGAGKLAADILTPVAEEMPGNAEIARSLARLHAEAGEPERAIRILAEALAAGREQLEVVELGVREVMAKSRSGTERRIASLAGEDGIPAAEAHHLAGVAAWYADKPYLAAEEFAAAAEADSEFLAAHESRVKVLLATLQLAKADAAVTEAREALGAEHYFADYLEGMVRLAERRPEAAGVALSRALDARADHTPSLLLLGRAMERGGEAMQAYERMIRAAQERSEDPLLRRELFQRLYDRNKSAAQKLLAVPGRSESMQRELAALRAEWHLRQGDLSAARAALARYQALEPEPLRAEVLSIAIDASLAGGLLPKREWVEALRRCRELAALRPDDPIAARLLHGLLLRGDLKGQAVEAVERLYRRRPGDLVAERVYVQACMTARRYDRAAEHLSETLRRDPQDTWSLERLVECLLEQDKHDEAIDALKEAIKTADRPELKLGMQLHLLRTLQEMERYGQLLAELGDLRGTAPPALREDLLALTVECQVKAERYAAAEATARKWQADAGGLRPTQVAAVHLSEAGRHGQAERLVRERLEAAEREADRDTYARLLVIVLGEAGKLAEAREAASDWIDRQPYALQPREVLVSVHFVAEAYDGALALVDEWIEDLSAVEEDDDDPPTGREELLNWCRRTGVSILAASDRYEQALRRVETYLADRPEDEEAWNLKSTCLAELGRKDEALAALEKAHELTPDEAMSNNNLGYYYADYGMKLDEAESMIRLAVAERPEETSFQDSLAWVLYKKGALRAAGGILHKLVESGRTLDHPVVLDHAGDAYYRLGWREKAAQSWRSAVEAGEESDRNNREVRRTLRKAREKLEALRAGREPKPAPLGPGIEPDLD